MQNTKTRVRSFKVLKFESPKVLRSKLELYNLRNLENFQLYNSPLSLEELAGFAPVFGGVSLPR
jgi:hypothetical protein